MSESGFCPSCGKVKEIQTLSYCVECFKKDRANYREVRKYLQEHPHSNAMDIAQGTDVGISEVLKYIKEKTFLLHEKGD